MRMNPMSTFRPAVGVRVYDELDHRWHTLDRAMAHDMEHWAAKLGPKDGYGNWDGLLLTGWLPPEGDQRKSAPKGAG